MRRRVRKHRCRRTFYGGGNSVPPYAKSCRVNAAPATIVTDRLSIVVGVTGHRDVAAGDEQQLRAAFAKIVGELSRRCLHSPLLVLSGLAPGADSLAAEEAITNGIPVLACLPMPVDEYERDFSPIELERFHRLLASCARVTVTSPTRENGYVATGRFIAQYSDLLVAFWDESPSRGAGGTADVVAMRMTGKPESDLEEIPFFPDVGPVDVIVTPHGQAPRPVDCFAAKRLYPQRFGPSSAAAENFESILNHIDVYNADLARKPTSVHGDGLQALLDRTDAAANRLQQRTNAFQIFLFACAFLAATLQVTGPLLGKLATLLLAFLAYALARRNDYENRYQDYRAIAEGLRVQSAWSCAGLRHRLVDNEYLRMQEGELQWIRLALRFFYLLFCEDREYPGASYEHPVCQDWVRQQTEYYDRAARRVTNLKVLLDRIALAALVAGSACTCVAGALLLAHVSARHGLLPALLTEPFVMAVVLGALLSHYADKQNLTANARRYRRMYFVFSRARQDLLLIGRGGAGDAQQVLYELGRAALAEHADWLIMRRDRPLKVVMV